MSTYGSRDKNPFRGPTTYKVNGVPTQSNLGNTRYYPLIDSATGEITIKSPTATGTANAKLGGKGEVYDTTVGTIPKDGVFTPVNASPDEIKYFSSAEGQKAVKNQSVKAVTKAGVDPQAAQQLIFPNTALPSVVTGGGAPGAPGAPGAAVPEPLPDPKNIPIPTINAVGQRKSYDNYYYPETLRKNELKQDFIQFIAYEYVGRGLNVGKSTKDSFDANIGFDPRKFGSALGSVTLPIQPSITDTNTVQWGGEELNSLQAYAASVSYTAQQDIAGTGERVLKDLDKIFKSTSSNPNISNAVRLFLAGKAVGVNGLLSRMGGAVINPNLELLFQGPQLRPFNFTFRLSPRSQTEAQQVKYIIRYFKQNMSVKNTEFNLFLKAPNVFKIKYHLRGSNADHPSLNRIKMCALQSCSVDYTPDGSYMTFNDDSATMTSYNLTLQFQELEPVTEQDYKDKELTDTQIGY